MMILYVLGGVIALGLGIYIGLGFPGLPGREDRVVPRRSSRRLNRQRTLDWLRPAERDRSQGFLTGRRDDD